MKSYIVLRLSSGKWAIMEKRTTAILLKFDSRQEAIDELKRVKENDKKALEEKKALKKEIQDEIRKSVPKFVFEGSSAILRSHTKSGKKVTLIGNNGLELRSRKCYTLYIDSNCIFTSGTIQAAMEYMLKN